LLLLLLLLLTDHVSGAYRAQNAGEIEHIYSHNANERVPCSQLPDIDLRPWIDRPHF